MSEAAAWRIVARGIFLVFALLFAIFLVRELKTVILQLVLASVIAAAASPLVNALTDSVHTRRWHLPRGIATLVVFLAGILLLVLVVLMVALAVGPDLRRFATNLPGYVQSTQTSFAELLSRYPELRAQFDGAMAGLQVQDVLSRAVGLLSQASQVIGIATSALGGVLHLVFTLILALYLTVDADRIRRYLIQFLPFERQDQALRVTERIGVRLGAWGRGQVILGAIVGAMTLVAALALGLPYVAVLTLVAAVGELVPNLGPIIAAIPLVIVGFLTSPTHGFVALGVAILIQQLENNLIAPRVMGQAVELHPLVVMLAILVGNELLGVVGALLAVPVAASLAVVVEELLEERRNRRNVILASEGRAAAEAPPA